VRPALIEYAAAVSDSQPSKLYRLRGVVGRWFGFAVFTGMTVHTALAMPPLAGPAVAVLRWGLVTSLFALFTIAYLRRPTAGALASRPVEIILPLVVIALPTAQAGVPTFLNPWMQDSGELRTVAMALFRPVGPGIGDIAALTGMAIGEGFCVYAMLFLGRSFSIMTEARNLVTGGPYRFVRHPLYLGELVAVCSYSMTRPSPWGLGVLLLFTVLQCWRARVEERKMLEHYPQYAALRAQTGFLWPRFRRRECSHEAAPRI